MKYSPLSRWFTVLNLALLTTASLTAQSTWSGATNNSWAIDTNWSGGIPSITSGNPSSVIFGSGNANTLTLDGTYYLNSLKIGGISYNYGTNKKIFANNGTLVFQTNPAGGVAALEFTSSDTTAVTDTTRDFGIASNLQLDSDLKLTFNANGSGTIGGVNHYRRVYLDGLISGDGDLTIYGNSSSITRTIAFTQHNTFTGDVYFQNGYVAQTFADSLGASDKTIYMGGGNSPTVGLTWDLQATSINAPITYHLDLNNLRADQTLLLQAGPVHRQLELTGNITGSSTRQANKAVLHLIAQTNEQLIFSGETMDFAGRVLVRYGSEVVVANGNSDGVAWENVSEVYWGEVNNSAGQNSAFVLRGDLTFNGNISVLDLVQTGTDRYSIGQINHRGTGFKNSYDAIFNGNINVLEDAYLGLNLISESGGSATFNGNISVAGFGMTVNQVVNATTSSNTISTTAGYYEAAPTGTVVIGQNARVAKTLSGTTSIGLTDVQNGTLVVNSNQFYSDVSVRSGARLAGTGTITGNVSMLAGSTLDVGSGTTSPSFASTIGNLEITGDLSLSGTAVIVFQAASASFNVADISSIPTLANEVWGQVGNHDFLTVGSELTLSQANSLKLVFDGSYVAARGDVFHLLEYDTLNTSGITAGSAWSLPDISSQSLFWNLSYFESHGLLVVDAPLSWTGAAVPDDNSWANPANWNGAAPSTNPDNPSRVVFGTKDLNTHTLTLDGQTFYLNSLTIDKAEYAAGAGFTKTLASNGTIVFKASDGVNPVITFNPVDYPASNPTTFDQKSFILGANVVLEDDLTINRVEPTQVLTNAGRRLTFDGVVSGDGKLYYASPNNSSAGMISFTKENTFTGDIHWGGGYIAQTFATGLGVSDKTIYITSGVQFTLDLNSATAHQSAGKNTGIGYNFDFATSGTRTFLINSGSVDRQLVFSGNFTGGSTATTYHLIAQGNEQMIFAGEQMTMAGIARPRFGTELVVAAANSSGIAWENITQFLMNETTTNANHTSAFLLRGDYTFKGAFNINDAAEPTSLTAFKHQVSIGQINTINGTSSTSHHALFTGNLNILEDDYDLLNLVSEKGGSATFNGAIALTSGTAGAKTLNINADISASKYYDGKPTGTVILGSTSRVASTLTGNVAIKKTMVNGGTLLVDTQHFYSTDVDVTPGATLGGSGKITGDVYISDGAQLKPGGSNNDPTGSLVIDGSLHLVAPGSATLDISAATFNISSNWDADIAVDYASQLNTVGDHDHLTVNGAFNIYETGAITVNFLHNYIPTAGDVFNLLDFVYLSPINTDVDYETLWDLPDLTQYDTSWSWKFDLAHQGVIYIVPEPQRAILLALALVCLITRRRRPTLAPL
jgi:hypothetical protein